MKLNKAIGGVVFDIDVPSEAQTYFFLSPSGTGKSFLFTTLYNQFLLQRKKVVLVDSSLYLNLGGSSEAVLEFFKGRVFDYVFLDNADLYLTIGLIQLIEQTAKHIFISKKTVRGIGLRSYCSCYVRYEGGSLVVRKKL